MKTETTKEFTASHERHARTAAALLSMPSVWVNICTVGDINLDHNPFQQVTASQITCVCVSAWPS